MKQPVGDHGLYVEDRAAALIVGHPIGGGPAAEVILTLPEVPLLIAELQRQQQLREQRQAEGAGHE